MTDSRELLDLFDRRVRGDLDAMADGAPAERDGPVVRVTFPGSGFIGTPADTGYRGARLDALIARQREHFAARGLPVEWKTYGYDRPHDLTERLRAAGFVPEEQETLLVAPTATLAGLPTEVDGVVFRETTDAADLAAIGRLHTEVWNADWSWIADDLAGRIVAGADRIRILLAEADGMLVSAAWLVMRPAAPFAGLWGGSTLPEWRRRGIYRALVARRARIAAERGYWYLQVDASEMSRPVLERLGFQALTTTTPYVWSP
ncbi:acetyltransferase (GNAT) family protein [Diaminobutyricimonas aerilata]|uniref:Acetyltransferase (GNAT) family protein n=1 Tax=Diaminobutyricimonas aerilata TaxID=1162967 RepID=A0A2M9CK36_9MICO|nr:GNAT family N-acetyltransferase [Diaminobutyricimonas aerilata]PJJ72238.1 acetyltransferase (GNAT) family protein [Diaminobutyricimonas aerilata]